MPPVMIESTDEQPVRGSFQVRVSGNKLLVPRSLAEALHKDGVRTAEDLVSYVQSFPSSVADTLQWSMSDVQDAVVKLKKELQGHVGDSHLNPVTRSKPGLGARDPKELK